eukprot:g26457.t1
MDDLSVALEGVKFGEPAEAQPAPAQPAPAQPAPAQPDKAQPDEAQPDEAQPAPAQPAPAQPAPQPIPPPLGSREFLRANKEVKLSRDGSDFKNGEGLVFRVVEIDRGIRNPIRQRFFLVEDHNNEITVFPSLTSIHKHFKDNMGSINFILPKAGHWRRR